MKKGKSSALYLVHETTATSGIGILESGNIQSGRKLGKINQSPYGELDYVFFNVTLEARLKTLLGSIYFVFDTDALVGRKFGVNKSHLGGGKANYKYRFKTKGKLDAQLQKVYDRSVSLSGGDTVVKFKHFLYLLYQEIYVKSQIDLKHLRMVIIKKDSSQTNIKRLEKKCLAMGIDIVKV